MKIWIQNEEPNLSFLIALSGAVKRGIYLDGTEMEVDALGLIVTSMEDQDYIPIIRVKAAPAMKKLHGGIAIIYGMRVLKSKADNKTLAIKPDGTKNEKDNAIEDVLKFFKLQKIPSSL
jgi:hypothetical protein